MVVNIISTSTYFSPLSLPALISISVAYPFRMIRNIVEICELLLNGNEEQYA